jgi:hypothetical protein
MAVDANKSVIILCLAFSTFVMLPEQSLELYRYTAQSIASARPGRLDRVLDSLTLLVSVVLVSMSFTSLAEFLRLVHTKGSRHEDQTDRRRGIIAAVAAVPSFAVCVGLARAMVDTHSFGLKQAMLLGARVSLEKDEKDAGPPEFVNELAQFDVDAQLQVNWWLFLGVALLLILSVVLPFAYRRVVAPFFHGLDFTGGRGTRFIAAGIAIPVTWSLLVALSPVFVARALTPFGVVCVFFSLASLFVAAMSLAEYRTRLPILFMLLVCAFLFSFVNDNHSIRTISEEPSNRPTQSAANSIGEGFKQWLKARKDSELYDAYPVYIVAAEGGGIYASFRAATFLSSLQDLCPRFSHHLFAISAVSGGSVGAAVFNALTQKMKLDEDRFRPGYGCLQHGRGSPKRFTDVAEAILQDDFLSPVLASFLFPDLLQRFLFFPIQRFDRSIALEKSLEASWDERTKKFRAENPEFWLDGGNPFRAAVAGSWRPNSDSPALFINTTEVACGRGRVVSPFELKTTDLASFPSRLAREEWRQGPAEHEISLSTAAVLSARFPWLTPPGWYEAVTEKDVQCGPSEILPQRIYLVDGGYLDNSGAITALAIVDELRRAMKDIAPGKAIQIHLIVLASRGFANPAVILSDLLAPFQTLLSTRAARGSIAVAQAEFQFSAAGLAERSGDVRNAFNRVDLQGYGYPLPLGWLLSPITRLLILGQNGDANACPTEEEGKDRSIMRTNCLQAAIYKIMNR